MKEEKRAACAKRWTTREAKLGNFIRDGSGGNVEGYISYRVIGIFEGRGVSSQVKRNMMFQVRLKTGKVARGDH